MIGNVQYNHQIEFWREFEKEINAVPREISIGKIYAHKFSVFEAPICIGICKKKIFNSQSKNLNETGNTSYFKIVD